MSFHEIPTSENKTTDGSPPAHASNAEITSENLRAALREFNSLTTARTGSVTEAFTPSKPAAPDGLVSHKNSYLDTAIHDIVDPITKKLGGSQGTADEVSFYTKSFVKTVPLFMTGRGAAVALAAAYVADEVKTHDSFKGQAEDAVLGLSKSLLLAGSMSYMRNRGFTPSLTALGLGISNRSIETGLTRDNYHDKQGNFDLKKGALTTASTTFNPVSLFIDSSAFIFSDLAWGRFYERGRQNALFNPILKNAIAAGTYGAATGMESEGYREWKTGKIDMALWAKRTAEQGAVSLFAGAVGGYQVRATERIGLPDAPEAKALARNTPYQRGDRHSIDSRQQTLRDGVFVPEKEGINLTTTTIFGHVETPEGNIPAVFRPHTGTEAFAHRMQTEIANYPLNKMIGYNNESPATVARSVDLGNGPLEGYIQEMRGETLLNTLKDAAVEMGGTKTRTAMSKALKSDTALKTAYEEGWVERMVLGEWDNHVLNQTVEKTPEKANLFNIDMGDALRPAQSKMDLVPGPQKRTGWEGLNWVLYKDLAGKPINPETKQKLADFVKVAETEDGQNQLRNMGLTDSQSAGVVGRAKWFAENGYFPVEAAPLVHFTQSYIRRMLRGDIRE